MQPASLGRLVCLGHPDDGTAGKSGGSAANSGAVRTQLGTGCRAHRKLCPGLQLIYKAIHDDPQPDELEGLVHVLEVDGPQIPNYLAVRVKGKPPLERTNSDIWRVPSQYGHNPNVPEDVPYWADLPWKERVKFYYKDISSVRLKASTWTAFVMQKRALTLPVAHDRVPLMLVLPYEPDWMSLKLIWHKPWPCSASG